MTQSNLARVMVFGCTRNVVIHVRCSGVLFCHQGLCLVGAMRTTLDKASTCRTLDFGQQECHNSQLSASSYKVLWYRRATIHEKGHFSRQCSRTLEAYVIQSTKAYLLHVKLDGTHLSIITPGVRELQYVCLGALFNGTCWTISKRQ